MTGCSRTRVRKQPIIALYFESETVLKFKNLEAGTTTTMGKRLSDDIQSYEVQGTCVIYFTKKRRHIHGNYTIHGHTLKIDKTGKYLEVTLSDDIHGTSMLILQYRKLITT